MADPTQTQQDNLPLKNNDNTQQNANQHDAQKQIDQCLGLMRGPTDEQRFVGLLLATKVIQPDDKENISKIYHAVGSKFLTKLLNSNNEEGLYKTLALNVLSTFCRNIPGILDEPFFIEKMPVFLDLIRESNDETLVGDAWACVESVLTSPNGVKKILQENYATFIAKFVADPGSDEKLHKIIQIIMHMSSILPSLQLNIYVDVYPLTEKLSEEFSKRRDLLKFELLDALISLVSTFNNQAIPSTPVPEWAVNIRTGVQEILTSKVTSKQRDPAIILSGLVLDLVGKAWPLGNESYHKFVELLLQVIKIEFRLQLEEDEIPESKFPLLTICFRILENYIQYLSASPNKNEWCNFDTDVLTRFGEAFADIFRDVLFLIRNHSNLTVGSPFYLLQESAVRVVGHWLASESEALRKDVADTLPSIMPYLEKNISLLETWLTVFPSLTTEELLRAEFLQQGGIPLVIGYISSHGKRQLDKCFSELKQSSQILGDATAILTNTIDIVLNLYFLAADVQHQSKLALELAPILPFLCDGLQVFAKIDVRHEEYLSIYAHFVSLTLIIMSQLPPTEIPAPHNIYTNVTTFFNKHSYFNEQIWDSVGDLWTLSVGGLIKCFPKHPQLKEQFTTSDLGNHLKRRQSSGSFPSFLQSSLAQLNPHI